MRARGASWTAIGSLVVLVVLYASALLAPWIAPSDYATQYREFPNCPPSPKLRPLKNFMPTHQGF